MKHRTISVVLALAVTVGIWGWSTYNSQRYYAYQLKQAHAVERVRIGSADYDVIDGDVSISGRPLSGIAAWRPRKLAYETELARLDPLFELAGTDPDALRSALPLLARTEALYAGTQTTTASSTAMFSLYPIPFLTALATLEGKRQALLADPTEANAQAYESELALIPDLKLHSIDSLERAFSDAVTPGFRLSVFSGELSYPSYRATLEAFRADAEQAQMRVRNRIDCLHGWYFACSDTLRFPSFQSVVGPTPPVATQQELLSVWRSAESGSEAAKDPRIFQLSQSDCLSSLGEPYDVTGQYQVTTTGTIFELSDADAIFFVPTASANTPFFSYVRNDLGMRYLSESPLKFYTCAQLGSDMGSVIALQNIAAFAASHPTIAPSARAAYLAGPVQSEYASRSYLAAALAQASYDTDPAALHALEELALMEVGKAGGLDSIIEDVFHVASVDTELHGAGIDTSVKTVFATHAAFPTWLRLGAMNGAIYTNLYATSSKAQQQDLISYGAIRQIEPRSTIVHDLRALLTFEGRYVPSTPSTTPSISSPASIERP